MLKFGEVEMLKEKFLNVEDLASAIKFCLTKKLITLLLT